MKLSMVGSVGDDFDGLPSAAQAKLGSRSTELESKRWDFRLTSFGRAGPVSDDGVDGFDVLASCSQAAFSWLASAERDDVCAATHSASVGMAARLDEIGLFNDPKSTS